MAAYCTRLQWKWDGLLNAHKTGYWWPWPRIYSKNGSADKAMATSKTISRKGRFLLAPSRLTKLMQWPEDKVSERSPSSLTTAPMNPCTDSNDTKILCDNPITGTLLVRLRGGLGNQMFQYACGRTLSHRHSRILLLDDSLLMSRPDATPRPYYLGSFNVQARLATFEQSRRESTVVCSLCQIKRGFHEDIFPSLPKVPLVVLDGYWVSELYFKSMEQLIQSELSLKNEPSDDNDLYRKIVTENSVCIHVRRTDYLTAFGSHMCVLEPDYYQHAISFIVSQLKDPFFVVFSDDIPWCQQHLRIPTPYLYLRDHNSPDDTTIADFWLMKNCKHFVIANSTYSWWAAWLAKNSNKIVIAPKNWFMGDVLPPKDVIPTEWKIL